MHPPQNKNLTTTQPSTTLLIVKAKTNITTANKLASKTAKPVNAKLQLARIAQQIQKSINTGIVWRLEGSSGRQASEAIEQGLCILGVESHRDFYGNYVPARSDVVEGTKGSVEYARARYGDGHVSALLAVDGVTLDEATTSILNECANA